MGSSVCRIIVALALAVGITSGSVHGQTTEERGEALTLLQESQRAYNAEEYDEALVLLRRAYDLYPAPGILYNLARTFEQLGLWAEAIEHYERYLDAVPQAEDGEEVRHRIAELRQQAAVERLAQDEDPPDDERPPILIPDPEPAEGPSLLGPALVLSGGTAVILAGIFPGMMAKDRDQSARNDGLSHGEAVSLRNQAEEHALTANILYGTGAAIAAGGLTWLIVRLVQGNEEPEAERNVQWYPGGIRGRF